MNSRIMCLCGFGHVPYQIMCTVMLAVRTGPMWYRSLTNSDEPSYFFEVWNWRLVVFCGHGRQAVEGLMKRKVVVRMVRVMRNGGGERWLVMDQWLMVVGCGV